MQGQYLGLFPEGNGKEGKDAARKGFPNLTGLKFTKERVSSQESTGQGIWRGLKYRGLDPHSTRRNKTKQNTADLMIVSPSPGLFPFLPEPEEPAATTHDSLSGRRAPTSDSAGQPEFTSWLRAGLVEAHLRAGNRVYPSTRKTGAQTRPGRRRYLAGGRRKWPCDELGGWGRTGEAGMCCLGLSKIWACLGNRCMAGKYDLVIPGTATTSVGVFLFSLLVLCPFEVIS